MSFAKLVSVCGLALALIVSGVSCKEKKNETTTTDSSTGGGTTSTFTAANIVKAWVSDCIAQADSRLGTSYYKIYITLNSSGTFYSQWYSYFAPSGSYATCSAADYTAVFTIYGTYTVGGLISGSSDTQSITFNTASSNPPSIMATGTSYTATQNAFNTDCGGTSPYCTLVSSSCTNNGKASGAGQDSYHMLCQNYTFPSSTGSLIYNVAKYNSSTAVLTLGVSTVGAPGVYSAGSVPAAATISYR